MKVHCWHTDCIIYFVINYLAIHFTNIEKIKKNFSGKNEIWFFCQLDKKLSSDQINHFLPYTGCNHRWYLAMKPLLYHSIPLLVCQYLLQLLDHGSWITKWCICCLSILWQKIWPASQSCLSCFICLTCFKDGMCLRFPLLYLIHRCRLLITFPWVQDSCITYQNYIAIGVFQIITKWK